MTIRFALLAMLLLPALASGDAQHVRTPIRAESTLVDRIPLDVILVERFPSPCKQTDAPFLKGFREVFVATRLRDFAGGDHDSPFALLSSSREAEKVQRVEFSVGSDASKEVEIADDESDSTAIANSYQNHVIVELSTWLNTPLGMKAWTTKRHSFWMGMRTHDYCERMGRYAATLVLETLLHDAGVLDEEAQLATPGASRDSVYSSKWND